MEKPKQAFILYQLIIRKKPSFQFSFIYASSNSLKDNSRILLFSDKLQHDTLS